MPLTGLWPRPTGYSPGVSQDQELPRDSKVLRQREKSGERREEDKRERAAPQSPDREDAHLSGQFRKHHNDIEDIPVLNA